MIRRLYSLNNYPPAYSIFILNFTLLFILFSYDTADTPDSPVSKYNRFDVRCELRFIFFIPAGHKTFERKYVWCILVKIRTAPDIFSAKITIKNYQESGAV